MLKKLPKLICDVEDGAQCFFCIVYNVSGLAMWWYLKFFCPLPLLIENTND
jgi:hypothetical protein